MPKITFVESDSMAFQKLTKLFLIRKFAVMLGLIEGTGASNIITTYLYVLVNVDSDALSGRCPYACCSQGFYEAEFVKARREKVFLLIFASF